MVTIAMLASLQSGVDAFFPTVRLRNPSSTCLSMGKTSTMPGPAGKGSSGPSVSEYRQKKMSNRLRKKNKKKKGGFSDDDDDENGSAPTKGKTIMDIELVTEPEGGDEVTRLVPLSDDVQNSDDFVIRLKDLGAVDESDEAYDLKDSLGAPVHNFWLTALAEGAAIQKTRNIVVRDASKKANFPGFRVGQIPPYAQPKMTQFALREVIVESCQAGIKLFGVNEINEGQLGAVTFNEDVDAISNKYNIKTCPSVPFTANFRGTFDQEALRKEDTPKEAAEEVETKEEESSEE